MNSEFVFKSHCIYCIKISIFVILLRCYSLKSSAMKMLLLISDFKMSFSSNLRQIKTKLKASQNYILTFKKISKHLEYFQWFLFWIKFSIILKLLSFDLYKVSAFISVYLFQFIEYFINMKNSRILNIKFETNNWKQS